MASLKARPSTGQEAGRLPFGVQVRVTGQSETAYQIRLPDGRVWWVDSSGLLPRDSWPSPDQDGIASTLDLMRQFVGVPYLWGGRSPYGFDCSGFTVAFWGFMGVSLPRDADQQFQAGKPVTGSLQPGDLLFFGNLAEDKPDERQKDRFSSISHVAVSLGGDEIIHANGTAWGVSYNSIDPASPRYRPWLREHYAGARRYP
jgi:cell wall-associated NlpC family hydrolase